MRESFAITTNPSASPLLQLARMPVIEGLKPATSHLTQTTPFSQRQYVIPRLCSPEPKPDGLSPPPDAFCTRIIQDFCRNGAPGAPICFSRSSWDLPRTLNAAEFERNLTR
ncbi:hypothetical protein LSAT2_005428 [Lamellibrachia satsuma]|nr:hypothetical protein LSAT2_005428 [Lamellibrachia satsuma]